MNSLVSCPSPFTIPYFENAQLIKTEIILILQNIAYNYTKPLSLENEPHSLETIPLVREHLDTDLLKVRHKSTTVSTEYSSFQVTFPQHEISSLRKYRRKSTPLFSKLLFKKFPMHS